MIVFSSFFSYINWIDFKFIHIFEPIVDKISDFVFQNC